MARVIPITANNTHYPDHYLCKDELIRACWHFAHAALWSDRQFSSTETTLIIEQIRKHLLITQNIKKSFLSFCTCILLAYRQLSKGPPNNFPPPSVWFHPAYKEGFENTLSRYHEIIAIRQEMKDYETNLIGTALYYWRYINNPNTELLKQFYKKLFKWRTPEIFPLFSMAINFHQFLYPIK